MPNTSACESLCFHLDYQTNAPSSLKVILCVLRTSGKMNVHWKWHVSQYKKKKERDDSDKVFSLLCYLLYASIQFSSVAQSCLTLRDPMNHSTPGLPVHHQLSEFTQTHIHRLSEAIQPSHPLLSPSPPAPSPSQHQGLFQWVNSSHEVAKVLEFQL